MREAPEKTIELNATVAQFNCIWFFAICKLIRHVGLYQLDCVNGSIIFTYACVLKS